MVETPGDLIVRKMTMERMDELKAQIREDKARFKQLKKEIDDIRSGGLDDKLQSMLDDIQRYWWGRCLNVKAVNLNESMKVEGTDP